MTKLFLIPYVKGGRSWDGADCWGLVQICYEEFFNIDLPKFFGIEFDSAKYTSKIVMSELPKNGFEKVDKPKFGDLTLINLNNCPVHIGFMLNDQEIIHTSNGNGVILSDINDSKYSKRIYGYYRYRNLKC